jgi:aspartyl/asparaginyl beta-hydroxylase
MSAIDARNLATSGVEALRSGNPRKARETFERIAAAGQADVSVCLALAVACRGLNDEPAALTALDRALTLEPRNLHALIMKADQLVRMNDPRGASTFYRAAVDVAPPPNQLPAELRSDLARAQAMCERYAADFNAYLRQRVFGQAPDRSTRRFRDSIDILTGAKKIFLQEPRQFFLPELPHVQFHDRSAFPWLDKLEAATPDIRAELIEVMKEDSAFKPYMVENPRQPKTGYLGLLNNPAWSSFYLWQQGELVEENARRCPKTVAALTDVPFSLVPKRSPSVMFSLLRPGARIPPHTGEMNTRLICHLPLIVPPNCTFRVGNEVRSWVEGKAFVFDDTIEHEAFNGSSEIRVVLLFEVWRPDLSEDERRYVVEMFKAIDDYGGATAA